MTRSRRVEAIVWAVSREYGLKPETILARGRTKRRAEARQVAMYVARVAGGRSYPQLGRDFGRDHTTIIHATQRIGAAVLGDERLRAIVDAVLASLKPGVAA